MNSRKTNLFAVFAAILMVAVPLAVIGDSADNTADAATSEISKELSWTNNAYHYVNSGIWKGVKIQNNENVDGLDRLSSVEMDGTDLKLKCVSTGAWAVSDNGWTSFDGSKWNSVTLTNSKNTLFSINDSVTLSLKDLTIWRCEAKNPIITTSSTDGTGSVTIDGKVVMGDPVKCEGYTIIKVATVDIYGDAEIYGTIDADVILHDGATLRGDVHVAGDITIENGADVTFGNSVTISGAFNTYGETGYENHAGSIRVVSTTTADFNNLRAEYDAALDKIVALESEKNKLNGDILSKDNNIKQLKDRIAELENVEAKLAEAKESVTDLEAQIETATKAAVSDAGTIADLRGQLEAAEKLASDNEDLYNASVEAANALQAQYDAKVDELGASNFMVMLTKGALEEMVGHCNTLYAETVKNAEKIENLEKNISTLEGDLDKATIDLDFLRLMNGLMQEEREDLIATSNAHTARIAELQSTIAETETLLKDSQGTADLYKALHEVSLSEVTRLTAEKDKIAVQLEEVNAALQKAEDAVDLKDSEIEFLNEIHDISMQEAERMKSEISDLTGTNSKLVSDIATLESKLIAAEENYAQEQRENDSLNAEVDDLREALNAKTEEAKGLTEGLSKANAKITALTGKLTAAENKQELTAEELEATNAALDEATADIESLEDELASVKDALVEKGEQIEAADKRNESLVSEIGYAHGEIRALKISLSNAKAEASNLGIQITGLNNQIVDIRNDATKTAEEKDAQIGQLSEELAATISDYKAATGEITDLNNEIIGLNSQIATLNDEKKALSGQIGDLEKENLGLISDAKRLTGELGDADAEIEGLKGLLDNANEKIEELEAALEAKRAKVASLEASAVTAASDIADLRVQVEEITAEKTALKAQLDEANASHTAAIAEMDVVKADLAKALEDLKAEQDKYSASESENTELEARIAELEIELENAKAATENAKNAGPVNAESDDAVSDSDVKIHVPEAAAPVKITVDSEAIDAVVGQKITLKTDAAREGLQFDGWYANGKRVSTDATFSMVVTSDVDIQQNWVAVGSAAEDVDHVATGSELGGLEAGSGDLIKCMAVLLLVLGGLYVVKRELA